ncbi:MAG: rRNA maturation RNase YbeY [Armatimonadetes bacterium]|nr:rRNA maturation RNase YbeY [Armatimonadota bacterium]
MKNKPRLVKLLLKNLYGRISVSKLYFQKVIDFTLNKENYFSLCEISILLTDNKFIKKINKIYRFINKPTDVLAFSQKEGVIFPSPRDLKFYPPLGDIIISIEQAKIQAKENNHSFKKELAILLIHGILHLLGYNDETEIEFKKMHRLQERILSMISAKKEII